MDIPTTLASVTAALGLVKELREIDTQVDQAEMKLKLAEITSALADAKMAVADASEEMQAREKDIAELNELLAYSSDHLTRYNGLYYDQEDDKPTGHPYCTVCYSEGMLIKLAENLNIGGAPSFCPKCKSSYGRVTKFAAGKNGR